MSPSRLGIRIGRASSDHLFPQHAPEYAPFIEDPYGVTFSVLALRLGQYIHIGKSVSGVK